MLNHFLNTSETTNIGFKIALLKNQLLGKGVVWIASNFKTLAMQYIDYILQKVIY